MFYSVAFNLKPETKKHKIETPHIWGVFGMYSEQVYFLFFINFVKSSLIGNGV